ncbi:MAG: polymer-forming cytoskeletal protein [Pseudomonadota bacterium]|jgi:cytoskeletal protein CcmA (bactofilin family)
MAGNTADSVAGANKFTLGQQGLGAAKAGATIIGQDAAIRGDLRSKGDLVISGTVEGEVSSESKLVIAQGGSVTGRITALEVVIEGRLVGDSSAQRSLSILASADVRGDVVTPVIMIEPGATFVGRCSMAEQKA